LETVIRSRAEVVLSGYVCELYVGEIADSGQKAERSSVDRSVMIELLVGGSDEAGKLEFD